MFPIRRLLLSPRLFSRVKPPPLPLNSNPTTVRHVKFKRPWIRRFITTCFLYGTAFHLWSSFVLLQFEDTLDDAETPPEPSPARKAVNRNPDAENRDHFSDKAVDEDPIFIPLSWPHLREGEFYTTTDPVWQEFIKISRDRKKLQSLRDELATTVSSNASRSKLLSQLLGGPLTITGFWLVHHFPSRAPPEYSQSGLEITDAGLSWVSKPMSSDDGDLLRRCLRPLYVTLAIRDAYMVLIERQLSRLNIMNFGQGQDSGVLELPPYEEALSSDFKNLDEISHVSQHESQMSLSSNPGEYTAQESDSRLHSSSIISSLQRLPLPKLGPGSDLHAASLAFRWRLNDCWARESCTPRRGTFYFAGPVGLKGPKGFCRIEVRGEYDPATSSWTTVSMKLKDLSIFNQKALG